MGIPISSVALHLEDRAHRKRRKAKRKGNPYPLENTKSGGGKKSKTKGANFEKNVAELFSAWLGCSVRRSPGSGAWATVGDFGPRGDLVFSVRVPFVVECKKHEGWDLTDLITGVRGKNTTCSNSIERWWEQAVRDAVAASKKKRKMPMLVFARNMTGTKTSKQMGVPPLLMMLRTDFDKMTILYGTVHADPYVKGMEKDQRVAMMNAGDFIPKLQFANDDGERIVCTLADFTKYVRPPKNTPGRKTWRRPKPV